jgi:hypothetical protein
MAWEQSQKRPGDIQETVEALSILISGRILDM